MKAAMYLRGAAELSESALRRARLGATIYLEDREGHEPDRYRAM
jgi:hypothetical protein